MSNTEWSVEEVVRGTEVQFKKIAGRGMLFDREAEFAIQAICKNDYTLKIAREAPQSVIDAVVNVAAIGLSLNPAERLAYLVPRDKKICLDISYIGLIRAATNDNAITWAHCAVVRQSDRFTLRGIDKSPVHEFAPFDTEESRGDVVGVYVTVKISNGDFLTHTMTIKEVEAIRDRSASYVANKTKTPWHTDKIEMIRKTCVKQASKYWPRPALAMSTLDKAIEILNNSGEGIEFASQNALLSGESSTKILEMPKETYTDDKFKSNLPEWEALIKGGRPPERVLSKICTKYALTQEQINTINELGK